MLWLAIVAIVGTTVALVYFIRRTWIAPWREVEELVKRIGRGERPRTFLIRGGKNVHRVAVGLEEIFDRQRELDRQIGERTSGQKAILSAMHDALLVVDSERRIALFNRTFQELFGINEGALGVPLLETVREPAIRDLVAEALRKREPGRRELTIGQRHWQMSAVPMQRSNGDATGAVILFHDITDLRRTDEIRRDFVANVSHELRTPLSILRGYIETMLDDPKMPRAECARILEVMDQHSKRLGFLANDLLTLAQLESGSSILQASEIDLLRFFTELVRDWKKKFAAKKLKAVVNVADDCPVIYADEARLREVFDNLLDNAVKYSGKGGEIRLSASRHGPEVALSVSDNGVGIAPQDLPRIFERFYRADKARSRELGGTGLGLSIVKHIAQIHGGHVEAESELGQGATIRVILPGAV